ncbi:MAG: preprotein translocase subunit YajC [Bacteroidales bacterium]|jgi:preprotein translocase subunit YajC|nr:preprotein translocase subunit YajC [Bacteroidales bacterium]
MNILFAFLNAAPANAAGQSSLSMWIMIALIFVVMYFFMIRPQNKQRKELQKFLNGLKNGDKVVTIGGINGTVKEVKEDKVVVEVDKGVCVTFLKSAIQGPQQAAVAAQKKDEKVEKTAAKEENAEQK